MKIFTITLLMLLGLNNAVAGDYDLSHRWGLGFGAGSEVVLGSQFAKDNLKANIAGGLWLRYHMSPGWQLELSGDYLAYKDPNANMLIPTLNLGYHFWATSATKLLFQIGAGQAIMKDLPTAVAGVSLDKNEFALRAKLALEFMLSHSTMLALNADYYTVKIDNSDVGTINNLVPSLGLTFYFGDDGAPAAAAAVAAPIAVAVAAPVDGDGDGISDDLDKCPGTAAGTKVNSLGCADTQKFEIAIKVQFAAGKAVLDEKASHEELQKFADFMNQHTETKAEVQGHTDNTGKEAYNMTVSQKRADAVRKYLISKFGIAADRLTAKGYGPKEPIADNKTAEGRAQNRRVEASISVTK